MPRSPQQYLDAALELLDQHGPADPTLGLGVKAVASGAEVSRSTIYRHWESVIDLNDDLVTYTVACSPGWQIEVLRQPVDQPFAVSIAQAIGATGPEAGVPTRGVVSGWPDSSPARRFVADWEAAWLLEFERWLEAHCTAIGRIHIDGTDGRSLAVTLAAMVEGQLIVGQYRQGPAVEDWDQALPGEVAQATARIFDRMTVEQPSMVAGTGTGPAPWAPRPLPDPGITGAKADIIVRTTAAYRAHPFGEPCSSIPTRLVDMARMARNLDVSERRLYAVWPTTASLNIDILEALFERFRASAEDLAGEVLTIGLSDQYDSFEHLNTSAMREAVLAGVRPGQVNYWGCGQALIDPEVRAVTAGFMERWLGALRTTFLALLSMTGWYRRVEISADEYTTLMLEGMIGLQRLASLHRGLLDEMAPYRDMSLSMCGLAGYQIARSLSTEEPPYFADPVQAPPLPGDLPRDDR